MRSVSSPPAATSAPPLLRTLVLFACLATYAPSQATDEAGVAASSGSREQQLIGATIERYEAAETYQLEFTQESYWALADSTQSTRGVLSVINPSQFSIRYENGGRIVVNAESLWVYIPETQQFFSGPVDSSDVAVDPARLLRQYVPDPEIPSRELDAGTMTIALRPRTGGREPSRLTVEIGRQSGLVESISARTSTGDVTRYSIHSTRFDLPVAPGDFLLARPSGAEAIEGGHAR